MDKPIRGTTFKIRSACANCGWPNEMHDAFGECPDDAADHATPSQPIGSSDLPYEPDCKVCGFSGAAHERICGIESSDDVERVARAIFDFERLKHMPVWENELPERREYARRKARAAIAALQPAAPVETGIDAVVEQAKRSLAALRAGDWDMGDVGVIEMALARLSAPQTDDRLREALEKARDHIRKSAVALDDLAVMEDIDAALASGGQHG